MIEAAAESERHFLISQVGSRAQVLFETYEKGINKGYTANYTLVQAAGKDLRNRLVTVLLTDVLQDTMIGEVLE